MNEHRVLNVLVNSTLGCACKFCSQLVSLPPVGIRNDVTFYLQNLFQLFEWHACKLAGLSKGSTEES